MPERIASSIESRDALLGGASRAFVAAMESLDFKPEILAGPIQFGKDRRDAMRSGFVVKYDGKTQKMMPGVYTWNGKD